MLTMYILPCDNPERSDFNKSRESLSTVANRIIELDHRNLNQIGNHRAKYFGFIFSDEWIDDGIKESIPLYLAQKRPDFDILVLMKKVLENTNGIRNDKIFQSPRIFRKDIKIESAGNLVPVEPEKYKFMRVLDGWILEPERILL